MSTLLRSVLLASFVGALLVGCGAKEAATDAAEAASDAVESTAEAVTDAADSAVETAREAVSNEPGGYVLPEEDRIPGITVDE